MNRLAPCHPCAPYHLCHPTTLVHPTTSAILPPLHLLPPLSTPSHPTTLVPLHRSTHLEHPPLLGLKFTKYMGPKDTLALREYIIEEWGSDQPRVGPSNPSPSPSLSPMGHSPSPGEMGSKSLGLNDGAGGELDDAASTRLREEMEVRCAQP